MSIANAVDQHPLLRGLDTPIAPVRTTRGYQIGLLVVAIAMLLLPLIYLALVACAAWGVCWYATHGTAVFSGRHNGKAQLFAYVAPLAIGALLVLFMVKPLFARAPHGPKRTTLDPRKEPLLFAFVARICAVIGAPVPRRIEVDCQVNASAGLRRGLLSMLGNDLVLTIGLPLVAGMEVRQLAGILAHEFGHFAQGTAMRLCFLIRSVNAWFHRVVYERDAWDERLVEWTNEGGWIAVVVGLARLLIWLTRRVLWVLMVIGHGISCFMSRQMEFDADRYEARLSGCDSFAATSSRLREMGMAAQGAHVDLRNAWSAGRLGDDLPALILANIPQIPDEVRKRALSTDGERTGWFDTHPCDRERIASAKAEDTPGVFRASGPATALFADFPALSRETTAAYYQEMIGPAFKRSNLVPTAELVQEVDAQQNAAKAAARYFQGAIGPWSPLQLPAALPPLGEAGTWRPLITAGRQAVVDGTARRLADKLEKSVDRTLSALSARSLLNARMSIKAAEFQLSAPTIEAVRVAQGQGEADRRTAGEAIAPMVTAVRDRLLTALALVHDPEIAAVLPDAEALAAEVDRLLVAAAAIAQARDAVDKLHVDFVALSALVNQIGDHQEHEGLRSAILGAMPGIARDLTALSTALGSATYPFAHSSGAVRMGDHIVPRIPQNDDLGGLMSIGSDALDKFFTLRGRVQARLAAIAEQAEQAAGFSPLPEPPSETASTASR